MPTERTCDAYLLDTYKNGTSGKFQPGAITFQGRKKIGFLRWKETFSSQREADAFVRTQMDGKGVREVGNEGELKR